MKKSILTFALCVCAAFSFAQKVKTEIVPLYSNDRDDTVPSFTITDNIASVAEFNGTIQVYGDSLQAIKMLFDEVVLLREKNNDLQHQFDSFVRFSNATLYYMSEGKLNKKSKQ